MIIWKSCTRKQTHSGSFENPSVTILQVKDVISANLKKEKKEYRLNRKSRCKWGIHKTEQENLIEQIFMEKERKNISLPFFVLKIRFPGWISLFIIF